MVKAFKIVLLIVFSTFSFGCGQKQPNETTPIWEQMKIWQLGKEPDKEQDAKTAFLNVYEFSIPVDSNGVFQKVTDTLYTQPIRYYDAEAFNANNFYVGYGRARMWDELRQKLVDAGAKARPALTLMLSYDYANDLAVKYLASQEHLFYTTAGGAMKDVAIGPGELVLRIEASQIPGEKGVCFLDLKPTFPAKELGIKGVTEKVGDGDMVFQSSGFKLKMGAGDMFLLGPRNESPERISLAGLFLNKISTKPTFKAYLFICTRIMD